MVISLHIIVLRDGTKAVIGSRQPPAGEMSNRRDAGFTVIELLWVIVLIGLMAALGIPRIRDAVQKQNVRGARVAAVAQVVKARNAAVQRGCRAVVHLR